MRRVRRIIGKTGAALSLLAALAAAALWVRSYWKTEAWYRGKYAPATRELRGYTVASQRGLAGFSYMYMRFNPAAELKTKFEGDGGWIYLVPYFAITYSGHWMPQKMDLPGQPPQTWWERAGVFVRTFHDPIRQSEPIGTDNFFMTVPYWMLVVLSSLWPIAWMFFWWRRRRKILAGVCLNCGYDLRASPERCPECGEPRTLLVALLPLPP